MGKTRQQPITSRVEDKTTFFYYAFRNILLVGLPLLVISGLVLSLSRSSATDSSSNSDSLAITISSSCTLSSVVNTPHVTEVYNGHYKDNIGKTTIKTLCNDGNGYSIYANGYSNNEEGNNKLINTEYPKYSIDTGLATSGLTSAWAMKLNNIENDPSPTPPTIESDYNNTYGLVPSYWTKVASRASGTTDMAEGSSLTTTYAVYASSSQYAGTYLGQVKYALLHPSTEPYYPFMQDVANWSNIRLPNIGDSIQAIDQRDGKIYWVTRLADGHIWMTQNLDFDLVTYTNNQGQEVMKPLTSNDTDLTDHSLAGAYSGANGYSYDENTGIISWIPTNKAKTLNFEGTTVTSWQNSNTEPYSASKTDDANTGHASLGNYYNWTAAIASNDSSSLTQNTLDNITNNPKNSICPKGWRLPTISNQSETAIGSTNEFARLNLLYNNNSTSANTGIISQPLYFTLAGNIDNNASYIPGTSDRSFYWSSTITSNNAQALILHNNGQVEPITVHGAGKFRGTSIRCLAR